MYYTAYLTLLPWTLSPDVKYSSVQSSSMLEDQRVESACGMFTFEPHGEPLGHRY